MEFNLVSKNNLGVVTALLLVIILSQGRFFNFLLDTALGRAILILFVLVISYANQILGVVSVLFIIIMFNNSNIGYMEGFDGTTGANGDNGANATGNNVGTIKNNATGANATGANATGANVGTIQNNATGANVTGANVGTIQNNATGSNGATGTYASNIQSNMNTPTNTTTPTTTPTLTGANMGTIQNKMNANNMNTTTTTTPTPTGANIGTIRSKIQEKINEKQMANGAEGFDILGAERNMQLGKRSNTIPVNKSNVDNVSPFDNSFSNLFSAFK
jgi:hypothetical protein